MTDIKIGLIGCGDLGLSVHQKILSKMPGVQLVALAETDPNRLAAARLMNPKALEFLDYRQLLASPEIDAVIIALPSALHAQAAIASLQAGKHVYLEKPIAMDLQDGRAVVKAWKESGLVGMMGMNHRFHPMNQKARQYLDSGKLGNIIYVRTTFSTAVRPLPSWKEKVETGGGVLFDLACHHLDLIQFLFGQDITEVSSTITSLHHEADTAFLRLRLSGNVPVECFFSWCSVDEDRYEIYGEKGKLTVDRYGSSSIQITDPDPRYARVKRLKEDLRSLLKSIGSKLSGPGIDSSYEIAMTHFVEAVRTGNKVSPDFPDGYRTLTVLEAALGSDKSNHVINQNQQLQNVI